jgi:hypothetical protein
MKKLIASIVLIGVVSLIVIAGEIPGSGAPKPPPPPDNIIVRIIKAIFG